MVSGATRSANTSAWVTATSLLVADPFTGGFSSRCTDIHSKMSAQGTFLSTKEKMPFSRYSRKELISHLFLYKVEASSVYSRNPKVNEVAVCH